MQNNGIDEILPFTYIQGQPYWGEGIAGIQITAVASTSGEWNTNDFQKRYSLWT